MAGATGGCPGSYFSVFGRSKFAKRHLFSELGSIFFERAPVMMRCCRCNVLGIPSGSAGGAGGRFIRRRFTSVKLKSYGRRGAVWRVA